MSPSPSAPAPGGAVVVPLPTPLAPVSAVRSTLLLASLGALRSAGYFDAYRDSLAPEHRAPVLDTVAGTWVPASAALAHYRACDALGLTSLGQMALGRQTGKALRNHLTRAVATLSRGIGFTPWVVFEQFSRFWARSFHGGGVSIVKLGPKDAEVVYARCGLLQSPYFRSALRGVALGLVESVAERVFMSEVAFHGARHEAHYRVSWV
jgi:hypothetical protein